MRATLHLTLCAAGLALAVLLSLGAQLQLRRGPSQRRALHHLLFAGVVGLSLAATGLAWALGRFPVALALLTLLTLLMPLTRPGAAAHWRLGSLIGAFYPLAAWLSW